MKCNKSCIQNPTCKGALSKHSPDRDTTHEIKKHFENLCVFEELLIINRKMTIYNQYLCSTRDSFIDEKLRPKHRVVKASVLEFLWSYEDENSQVCHISKSIVQLPKCRWRSGESTCLPPMWPGFDSRTRRHVWVEFVVGFRPYPKRFFSRYSGFPLSSETNISKFQFDLGYCQALYHEPLAVSLTLNKLLYFLTFTCTLDIQARKLQRVALQCC